MSLREFLHRERKSVKLKTELKELINGISVAGDAGRSHQKMIINTNESISVIEVDDIVRCESNLNYTTVYLGNKKITVSKTLMDFEKRLARFDFLRVHKSHLVNLNHIEKYIKAEGGYIVMKDGSKLPLSVRKKESLLAEFQKLDV